MVRSTKEVSQLIDRAHNVGVYFVNLPVVNFDTVSEVVSLVEEFFGVQFWQTLVAQTTPSMVDDERVFL